jgi:DNA sulfur modification protein DndD
MKRRVQFTDRIRDLQSELDDVTRQLQGSPIEEIAELEGKRKTFEMDIERHHLEIGKCRGIIEDRDREIAELTKQIEQAQKRKSKNELLTRKISLAQQSADAVDKIYQELGEDVRQSIEAKTQEIFKKLVWKESHFKNISLGPDYQLEVIDRYGLPARPELSAGERQVLSLSFITAMVRVSEEEAPIVMDTPFGRLSSEHRASITENLPGLTPQLVLFVTDEELHDEARKNLEKRIGKEYRLIFDPKISSTTIEEAT